MAKIQMPPEVVAEVKREAGLEKERARIDKAWDSIANTAFGLLSSRKESSPVDLAGIQQSVDQIADLLRLKLEIVRTFAELGQGRRSQRSSEETPAHNGQGDG